MAKHKILAKTSANNSGGICTAWVVVVVPVSSSYLLGTNKGSGERLTLVSVLWTSSLQQEGEGGGKGGKKGEGGAHLGKFAHAAYSPASHAALNSRLLAATLATKQGKDGGCESTRRRPSICKFNSRL